MDKIEYGLLGLFIDRKGCMVSDVENMLGQQFLQADNRASSAR